MVIMNASFYCFSDVDHAIMAIFSGSSSISLVVSGNFNENAVVINSQNHTRGRS